MELETVSDNTKPGMNKSAKLQIAKKWLFVEPTDGAVARLHTRVDNPQEPSSTFALSGMHCLDTMDGTRILCSPGLGPLRDFKDRPMLDRF